MLASIAPDQSISIFSLEKVSFSVGTGMVNLSNFELNSSLTLNESEGPIFVLSPVFRSRLNLLQERE